MKKYYSLLFLLLFTGLGFAKNTISDYRRMVLPVYTPTGDLMLAIRVFKMNDIPSFLVVDPSSLETKVMPINTFQSPQTVHQRKPGYLTHWQIASTRYYQLLNKSTAEPYSIDNQGITHASRASEGNILTIDLCPSNKPFEAEFFNKLVALSTHSNHPIPITIAISGMWLIGHPQEFQWLVAQKKANKLNITWANHSFSHVYYKDQPYSENFLLAENTNVDAEFLLTEQYLLEAGELPSVFFRFPGLVSDKNLVKKIKEYGLIPLSTDAWIASLLEKHQTITPGGIILVHGNHNEHKGILLLLPLLDSLKFLDIREAL